MNKIKTCYICESKNIKLLKTVNNIPIFKCKNCKLLWVPPNKIPDHTIKNFYDKSYYQSNSKTGYENYLNDEILHRKNAQNIIKTVSKFIKNEKLTALDIGCAHGFLLDELKKTMTSEVHGIELSKHSYKYAKNTLKLDVMNQDFNPKLYKKNYFDLIFLIGTIEHLKKPKQMLNDIKTILKKEGLLVITTINTKGALPLYMLKPPEHLFYFSHKNIKQLLKNSNYEIKINKLYFVNYYLHDLFIRFNKFSGLTIFRFLGEILKRKFPNFSIKIPTNEMIVIVKNMT